MNRRIELRALWITCLALSLAARASATGSDSSAVRSGEPAEALDPARLNAYGISLALAREPDKAEGAFFSVLSQKRADGRAYNNLGNLHVMKGDYAVALSFYDSAARADSNDAGVHLNRAAVLLLLGDKAKALDAATLATRLAGGAEQAAELMGLREGARESSRAADKKRLSPAEMRALLHKAAGAVPARSGKPAAAPNVEREQGKSTPASSLRGGSMRADKSPSDAEAARQGTRSSVWRSGSMRAADAPSDAEAATMLYWKR